MKKTTLTDNLISINPYELGPNQKGSLLFRELCLRKLSFTLTTMSSTIIFVKTKTLTHTLFKGN